MTRVYYYLTSICVVIFIISFLQSSLLLGQIQLSNYGNIDSYTKLYHFTKIENDQLLCWGAKSINNQMGLDIVRYRFTGAGQVLDSTIISIPKDQESVAAFSLSDGGCINAYSTSSSYALTPNIYIERNDSNGEQLWLEVINAGFRNELVSFSTDSLGNSYALVRFWDNYYGALPSRFKIYKITIEGSIAWDMALPTDSDPEYVYAVTSEDVILVSKDLDQRTILTKYNSDGQLMWQQLYSSLPANMWLKSYTSINNELLFLDGNSLRILSVDPLDGGLDSYLPLGVDFVAITPFNKIFNFNGKLLMNYLNEVLVFTLLGEEYEITDRYLINPQEIVDIGRITTSKWGILYRNGNWSTLDLENEELIVETLVSNTLPSNPLISGEVSTSAEFIQITNEWLVACVDESRFDYGLNIRVNAETGVPIFDTLAITHNSNRSRYNYTIPGQSQSVSVNISSFGTDTLHVRFHDNDGQLIQRINHVPSLQNVGPLQTVRYDDGVIKALFFRVANQQNELITIDPVQQEITDTNFFSLPIRIFDVFALEDYHIGLINTTLEGVEVAKIDSIGELKWYSNISLSPGKSVFNSGPNYLRIPPYNLDASPSGDINLCAINTLAYGAEDPDYHLYLFDSDGAIIDSFITNRSYLSARSSFVGNETILIVGFAPNFDSELPSNEYLFYIDFYNLQGQLIGQTIYEVSHPAKISGVDLYEFDNEQLVILSGAYLNDSDINALFLAFDLEGHIISSSISTVMSSNFLIFPNPSSGILRMRLDSPSNHNAAVVRVYDAGLRLVEQLQISINEIQGGTWEGDFTYLPSGVYLIEVFNEDFRQTLRWIKQ
jgi:hypothetical protein